MARDLARFGIRVMTIAPGIMETPLMLAASEKVKKGLLTQVVGPKRFGAPNEFAHLCASIIDNG
jgi:NAD(P)-dependent dehydrogenase (short-subunit alcohol dehydrogenase family)